MRIAKNTEITLEEVPSTRFLLVIDVMDGDVLLEKEKDTLVYIRLEENDVLATLHYPDGRKKTLVGVGARGKEVILTAGYARAGLYVGGVLLDEDFFFTPIDYKGARVTAGSFMHFEAGYEYHSADESAIVDAVTHALDGYRPIGHRRFVARALPTVVEDRLYLHYLDGRSEREEGDKPARKLSSLFSDDGEIFHGAPIALHFDNVREMDFVDAALLAKDGRYYLYYIVDYATHRALTCAVSEDGFSFLKTGLDLEIAGVDNKKVTAIAMADGDTPRLYFVMDGCAYFAESIDLLHFSRPVLLELPAVDKVIPIENGDLYAQKEGRLYRAERGALTPVENAPRDAYPVFYRGALCLIGTECGAFAYKKI